MIRRRDPLANPEQLIRRVYSYAAYVVGPGPDAEDVASETIERALRYRDSYDSRKGTPEAWLLGIARRVVAARAFSTAGWQDEAEEQPEPGDLAEESAQRLAVQAAVATLPERDRELVALRYGADLTAREIGELLGMKTNAVEVALHRLHAKLRELLAEDGAPRRPLPKSARKGSPAVGGM